MPERKDAVHERIVAEGLFASTSLPDCRFILDPLVDVDRSSDINNGLLDRLSNPRTPFHVARCLNTILFSHGKAYSLAPNSTMHARGITSDNDHIWLLFPGHDIDAQTLLLGRHNLMPDTTWIDLVLGTSQVLSDIGQVENLVSQLEHPALLKTELSPNDEYSGTSKE
jgi:ankyrin repeat protein